MAGEMALMTGAGEVEIRVVVTEDDFLADAVGQVLGGAGFVVERRRRGPVEPLLVDERPALLVMDTGDVLLAERQVLVRGVRQASDVPLIVLTRSTLPRGPAGRASRRAPTRCSSPRSRSPSCAGR